MTFGVTITGFVKKTFNDVYDGVKTAITSVPGMSRTNLERDSYFGNVVANLSAAISETWDVLQDVYSSWDPDAASERSLENLCKLTGTRRRSATYTTVSASVNVDPGTYPIGSLVASVVGSPTSRFSNSVEVFNGGGAPSTIVGVPFVADNVGPVRCPSGLLTVRASPYTGWNSVTNPLDGVLGRLRETDAELRIRREQELSVNGASTFDAMLADIRADARVASVKLFVNDTDATELGLPPHSFECVVYDGSTDGSIMTDAEIAALVWASKPSGITSYGTTTVYTPGADGHNHLVSFSRPTVRAIYAAFTVTQIPGVAVDPLTDLKTAVVDYARRTYSVGDDVVWSSLFVPAFVPGIYDVSSLFIGFAPMPSGTANLTITEREIAVFDTSRITVV